jgi:hypothetical protein
LRGLRACPSCTHPFHSPRRSRTATPCQTIPVFRPLHQSFTGRFRGRYRTYRSAIHCSMSQRMLGRWEVGKGCRWCMKNGWRSTPRLPRSSRRVGRADTFTITTPQKIIRLSLECFNSIIYEARNCLTAVDLPKFHQALAELREEPDCDNADRRSEKCLKICNSKTKECAVAEARMN